MRMATWLSRPDAQRGKVGCLRLGNEPGAKKFETREVGLPQRFRFDLESSHIAIRDEAGVEAESLDQAIEQAEAGIEEMRASGEMPPSSETWELVIRDEDGVELKRLPV